MLKSKGCHNNRYPGDIKHTHTHKQAQGRDVGKEPKILTLYLHGRSQRLLEHRKSFLPAEKEKEKRQRWRMVSVLLQQSVHVTCRPVSLSTFLSPSERHRRPVDIHIWPRGRSCRRSLFNNTVPGLSWQG